MGMAATVSIRSFSTWFASAPSAAPRALTSAAPDTSIVPSVCRRFLAWAARLLFQGSGRWAQATRRSSPWSGLRIRAWRHELMFARRSSARPSNIGKTCGRKLISSHLSPGISFWSGEDLINLGLISFTGAWLSLAVDTFCRSAFNFVVRCSTALRLLQQQPLLGLEATSPTKLRCLKIRVQGGASLPGLPSKRAQVGLPRGCHCNGEPGTRHREKQTEVGAGCPSSSREI